MAREILARATNTRFSVIAPRDPGWEEADAASPVPVKRVPAVAPGRRGFVPTVNAAVIAHIRRERPDAVLAMHTLAAPGALLARAPLVVVCHGGELRSPRIRAVARRVLPRARRVVANSAYTRSGAVALGADPLRTVVLPVGAPDPVDVPDEQVAAVRARFGRYVLSVARLEPHKGHDRLIRAMAGVEDANLVIVGTGSAEAHLRAAAAEAGVAGRVTFAGAVSDDELPAYFAAASAFALLSRETSGPQGGVEGGGIALLEACAYGLPVVAGATGGIPETIRNGDTGLLVDPEDVQAVAAALRRVLGETALAASLGKAAFAMATGERSWARFVERIEQILDQAAEGR